MRVIVPLNKIPSENIFWIKCYLVCLLLRGLFGSFHILHDTPLSGSLRFSCLGTNFLNLASMVSAYSLVKIQHKLSLCFSTVPWIRVCTSESSGALPVMYFANSATYVLPLGTRKIGGARNRILPFQPNYHFSSQLSSNSVLLDCYKIRH